MFVQEKFTKCTYLVRIYILLNIKCKIRCASEGREEKNNKKKQNNVKFSKYSFFAGQFFIATKIKVKNKLTL